MTSKKSTIATVIGQAYTKYTQALTEARELLSRSELDSEEKSCLAELVGQLKKDRKSSQLLPPNQSLELEQLLTDYAELTVPAEAAVKEITADYVILKDISCVDADGQVWQKYDKLYVAKDIVRNPNGSQVSFTPYLAVVRFEKQENGLYLPDPATSCNIIVALYRNKDDSEINKVLMQYKDKGNGTGWHAQNGLVNYETEKLIYYPQDDDFPNNGGTQNINQNKSRIELPFRKAGLSDETLEEGLKIPDILYFERQFTGLEDPGVLLEVADYFGRTARVWFPDNAESCTDTRAAWLGSSSRIFYLDADVRLGSSIAARPVVANPSTP